MTRNVRQLVLQARKLDRLNTRTTQVIDAMRGGAALQLEYRYGAQRWRLTNGCEVHPEVARLVIRNPNIASVGDVLFVGMLAQTFRYVEANQPQMKTGV
jgi:hypothetical protein